MPLWNLAVAFSRFQASLNIVNDVELTEQMLTVAFGRRFGEDFTLNIVGGGILGGDLTDSVSGEHEVSQGVIGSVQGTQRLVRQRGARPFVLGTLSFSASRTTTTPMAGGSSSSLVATDFRVSAMAGYRLRKRFTVHSAARAFAGPVFWSNVDDPGSDRHFFQLAVGGSVFLPGKTRLFTEWAFLGERNITVGVARSFR